MAATEQNQEQTRGLFRLGRSSIRDIGEYLWSGSAVEEEIKCVSHVYGENGDVSAWLSKVRISLIGNGMADAPQVDVTGVLDSGECNCVGQCNCSEIKEETAKEWEEKRLALEVHLEREKWYIRDNGGVSLQNCMTQLGFEAV
jgi:hypothetical protein